MEELSGVSKSRLSEAVNHDKAPLNTNELGRICEALSVPASHLLKRAESSLAAELNQNDLTRSDLSLAASADRGQAADVNEEDYF